VSFEIRSELVTAINDVEGVTGYAKRPGAGRTGDAWPRWAGAERVDGGPFETTWQIRVLVPNDEIAQDAWISEHLDELIDAVTPVAYVESIELTTSAETPCLQLNCKE
jgi:hypothetical protein